MLSAAFPSYDTYRFQRVIDLTGRERNFQSWLDLGCHNGMFARLLTACGFRVTGVDVWDPALKSDEDASWQYIQADLASGLPAMAASSFDVVSALEVLEHMIDTDAFLKEVGRLLKPGGRFVLSTPNICMLQNRVRVLAGRYPYGLEYRNVLHHVRLYNLDGLRAQLTEHGFRVLTARGEKALPQRLMTASFARRVSENLAQWLPTLCANFVVVAERPI
jgi:2-polyprenyl-3-methyl-5-hydroxy-6-metoxy-1,4-benzoquinol methylase